jgi:Tfp pilus assembly protein PilF
MTTRLLHWIGVCAALALAATLSACAVLSPPPSPEPLLQDTLFGHPPRPVGADEVFAVNDAMRAQVRAVVDRVGRVAERPAALAQSLDTMGDLRLEYDASITRNAAQAYEARAGNCLSLVVMTAALAHEMGLEVGFQSTRSGDVVSRESDLMLRSGHVNLLLGTHRPPGKFGGMTLNLDNERLLVDFLPPEALRGVPLETIDERRVLAMYMNNRAVETLLVQRPAEAYAWAREAVRRDSGFWAAYNTLGVIYQRAGHLAAAAAVFEHALAQDPRNVAVMGNLEQVLQAQGHEAEAARWAERRLALEPYPPFHFLRLGQAAMAQRDYVQARRLFNREMSSSGPSHELHFWLAQAHLALGDTQAAQQAMRRAMEWSATPVQQARYAAKLAALKAIAVH